MLMAGGVGLGLSGIKHLEERVYVLRSLIHCMELIEWELSFRAPVLKDLLAQVSEHTSRAVGQFLNECIVNMENMERPMAEIWQSSARNNLKMLKKSDLDMLLALGNTLGKYDLDNQRKSIENTRQNLLGALQEAVLERRRMGRVYGTLGTAVGVFLILLLL